MERQRQMTAAPCRFRVAMIAACPFPWPRGTPIRIYRMAQALSECRHDVHVITYHLGQKGPTPPFCIHRIPEVPFYKKTGPGPSIAKLLMADPVLSIKILILHRSLQFDIIHAHHVEGFLAALPLHFLYRVPIIFDMHTLLETELPFYLKSGGAKKGLIKRIGRMIDRYLPKSANHVIGVTEEIKDFLLDQAKIPAKKISVIPNGIELSHFSRATPQPEKERDRIILGFAGNCAPYQGIDVMLDALDVLRSDHPSIRLHLYTNDADGAYEFITKRPEISPMVDVLSSDFGQLPDQLAQADILLNPRPHGAGHPLKLLNYMAAGKPIVSLAGTARLLKHGETAWIAGDNTAQAFAQGIVHLIAHKDIATAIGRNAKDFLSRWFSWESRAEEITVIYKKLIKNSWQRK